MFTWSPSERRQVTGLWPVLAESLLPLKTFEHLNMERNNLQFSLSGKTSLKLLLQSLLSFIPTWGKHENV